MDYPLAHLNFKCSNYMHPPVPVYLATPMPWPPSSPESCHAKTSLQMLVLIPVEDQAGTNPTNPSFCMITTIIFNVCRQQVQFSSECHMVTYQKNDKDRP